MSFCFWTILWITYFFYKILRTNIHQNQPNRDPLHKIRPIFWFNSAKMHRILLSESKSDSGWRHMCSFQDRISFLFCPWKTNLINIDFSFMYWVMKKAVIYWIWNITEVNLVILIIVSTLMLWLSENNFDKRFTINMDPFNSNPSLFYFL